MMGNWMTDQGEPVIEIDYVRPDDLLTLDITGARIIQTPYNVLMDFYIDEPIDFLAGVMIFEKDGKRNSQPKYAYDGPRRIIRKVVVRLRLPHTTFQELGTTLSKILFEAESPKKEKVDVSNESGKQ